PIDLIITREDCLPKPHPEGLLKVAEQWQITPKELAYVGDYKFDLMAAKNAGMRAILLSTKRNAEFHTLADWVIDDFSELSSIYSN
ncbi:MAG: HAD hydrolase-like protein, partial [Kangiellaceae bacterium]|nr:HAD hydrolase-like protein [Kangiellaceae bacterium]